ncbi:MAG: phosphoesterase [Planctomycetaceae bacterium]|nr:phosphoesterase [Planctomycetaceae bacterium]
MSTVADEHVLVVPTSEFHALGHFQGFSKDIDTYLPALLESSQIAYRPRSVMEQDPSFKQLIPYVVFRYVDAEGIPRVFQYTRGGGQGEARLHAKRSVGIGGHISTLDSGAGTVNDVYHEGLQRELDEEVAIETPYTEKCVGLINDDETPVGKVHLGIVHLFDVETSHVHPREDDILNAGFQPIEELLTQLEDFETWSQIVVPALFG